MIGKQFSPRLMLLLISYTYSLVQLLGVQSYAHRSPTENNGTNLWVNTYKNALEDTLFHSYPPFIPSILEYLFFLSGHMRHAATDFCKTILLFYFFAKRWTPYMHDAKNTNIKEEMYLHPNYSKCCIKTTLSEGALSLELSQEWVSTKCWVFSVWPKHLEFRWSIVLRFFSAYRRMYICYCKKSCE